MQTIPVEQSASMIPDGASLMIGGFMAVGTPERLIDEIVRQNRRNLTVIANDTALPGRGIGKLISAKLVRKAIVSHIGLNPETQKQMMAGEIEVELVPQGTLIERIRAGGYGLGGVLTETGLGTPVEEGKQRIDVNGKSYLVEVALKADFALVQAFFGVHLARQYFLTHFEQTCAEERGLRVVHVVVFGHRADQGFGQLARRDGRCLGLGRRLGGRLAGRRLRQGLCRGARSVRRH